MFDWVKSYLSNHKQYCYAGEDSVEQDIQCGVQLFMFVAETKIVYKNVDCIMYHTILLVLHHISESDE